MSGFAAVYDSPLPGRLRIGLTLRDGAVTGLDFTREPVKAGQNPACQQVGHWLAAYFAGEPDRPLPPIAPSGTPYQGRVWQVLTAIHRGDVRSYGDISRELTSSPRAVAAACKANPIPLLIPCHRVVAAHGIGGFMGAVDGDPIRLKEWLLRHEGAI